MDTRNSKSARILEDDSSLDDAHFGSGGHKGSVGGRLLPDHPELDDDEEERREPGTDKPNPSKKWT